MKNASEYSDTELFRLIKEDNEIAYSMLYQRYWSLLFIHAGKMLRDEVEAMDVVQEVFTNLWMKREGIHIIGPVKAYLYRSVRNETLNHINRHKVKEKYIDSLAAFIESSKNVTEEHVLFAELIELIEREIAALPEKMRSIFELSRFHGLSHENISEELNISSHTVKKTINRAIKQLRRQIKMMIFTLA